MPTTAEAADQNTIIITFVLAMIAASIALAAYLGSVRFRYMDRGFHRRGHPERYRLVLLIPPDILFFATFWLLTIGIILELICGTRHAWLLKIGTGAFLLAILFLLGLHALEWCRLIGWCKERPREPAAGPVTIECSDANVEFSITGSKTTIRFHAKDGTVKVNGQEIAARPRE